jgi:hypothetical protein
MNRKIIMVLLLCAAAAAAGFAQATPIPFDGWYQWGGLQPTVNGNSVTLNGRVTSAGYSNEWLNAEALRGKTVTLEIRNASASKPSEGRLVKITVNRNDILVRPSNIPTLVHGEYVPASVTQAVFTLPPDFDGKLGFVFYQAELNGLVLTLTYR